MKRALLLLLCLLLCLPVSGCSESYQERKDRERDLADSAYQDGYDDGYNDGYEDGYRDGLSVRSQQAAAPFRSSPVHADYILNTRSKVFHHPSCTSVSAMNEENKKSFSGSREEIIEMGYKPCGRCNP